MEAAVDRLVVELTTAVLLAAAVVGEVLGETTVVELTTGTEVVTRVDPATVVVKEDSAPAKNTQCQYVFNPRWHISVPPAFPVGVVEVVPAWLVVVAAPLDVPSELRQNVLRDKTFASRQRSWRRSRMQARMKELENSNMAVSRRRKHRSSTKTEALAHLAV